MAGRKTQNREFQKVMEMAGLAFSVIFELAAGPFVGLLIGRFLVGHCGLHPSVLTIAVVIGFIAGAYNVSVTIRMMNKISQ